MGLDRVKGIHQIILSFRHQQQNETRVHALYSTPSCYTNSINQVAKKWTTKSDDFFPYADFIHAFWTGYFVSRSALKGYVRETNALLQVTWPFSSENTKTNNIFLSRLNPAQFSRFLITRCISDVSNKSDFKTVGRQVGLQCKSNGITEEWQSSIMMKICSQHYDLIWN